MRRLAPVLLVAVLLFAAVPVPPGSLAAAVSRPDASQPALTTEMLLGMATDTGNPHALESQLGFAQLMILVMSLDLPAYNDKNPALMNIANSTSVMIDDTGGGMTPLTLRERYENLVRQADRIASSSRGRGEVNGTAALRTDAEKALLGISQQYAAQLVSTLENGDAATAAYASNLKELLDLRTRVRSLSDSADTEVAAGARTLLAEIADKLEGFYDDRAAALQSVLESADSSASAKAAAARELMDIVVDSRNLPRGGTLGSSERAAHTYYENRVDALTRILDDAAATPAAKAAALVELRRLRETLVRYGSSTSTGSVRDSNPAADVLADIERRLMDGISTRLGQLRAITESSTATADAKSAAVTEMFELWSELRGLTYGQAARRNDGDTSHDDLIAATNTQLVALIEARLAELTTTAPGDLSSADLAANSTELLTAWERLRDLGQTNTTLYERVEGRLRELYGSRAQNLMDTLQGDGTDASKAAAARALAELVNQYKVLDRSRSTAERPFIDGDRVRVEDELDAYVSTRVRQLTEVVDNPGTDARTKAAAIAELQQLRTILVDSLGRSSGPSTGGRAGDWRVGDIDRRLGEISRARVSELAATIRSSTATAAQKLGAINELEGLRNSIREQGADPTGELEQSIDGLLQEGLKQQLQELREEEGAAGGAPITRGNSGDGTKVMIDAAAASSTFASSAATLAAFGTPGGPQVAALARSTGNSSGPGAFEFLIANSGPAASFNGDGLVLEPIATEDVDRVRTEWSRIASAANAVVAGVPEGYCLEKEKRPPTPGELFAITALGKQQQFAPQRSIIDSGRALAQAGQLSPEDGNDPQAYLHSILQWSIWTHEGGFDQAQFTEAFVQHTRDNLEGQGFAWSDGIEQQVRSWAPNRWSDVQNTLTGANLGIAG